MKRRQFIQSGLAATALPFIPRLSFAQEIGGEFFLQFYMDGGWDTTLATEAWDFTTAPDEKRIFIEYADEERLAFPGGFLPPPIAPLRNYFDRMTIFNGVIMSSAEVGHTSPTTFALSGVSDGKEAHFSCQFIENFYNPKDATVLANGTVDTVGKNFKTASFEAINSVMSYVTQDIVPESDSLIDKAYYDLELVAKKFKKIDEDYKTYLQQITNQTTKQLCLGFLSGYFPAAAVRTPGFLDTHSGHIGTHKNAVTNNFQYIKDFLDALRVVPWGNTGKSLLDVTTVVITSEFTRTPALNISKGKDHNPFSNSMIVMSPKFKPGIVGKSRLLDAKLSPIGVSTLVAMPLHKENLNPLLQDKDTFMLKPSNIYASLLDASGKLNLKSPEAFRKATLLKSIYR